MITKVIGKDFKGLTFEQPLGRLNLLVGPNGSGKSARTQALILAVMGYIPGGAKKNAEILGADGTEDTMVVGFEADVLFERAFVLSKGAVSQGYKIAGGRVKEGEFQKSLGLHGNPKIVDISAFMELSDQKKIDAVFSLYPPAGDVNKIQGEIDGLKEKINTLNAKAKTSEAAAARLVAAKPPLPAGTLADVTGKIETISHDLVIAREELSAAKQAEAARIATEKAEKKAAEDAEKLKAKQALEAEHAKAAAIEEGKRQAEKAAQERLEAEAKAAKETAQEKPLVTDAQVAASLAERPGEMTKECDRLLGKYPTSKETLLPEGWVNVVQSIQAILDALNAAGCQSCAARLVAIRELRKYEVKA